MAELEGNNFSYNEIKKWYDEENAYYNQFKGGRSKEYWSIYEVFNRKYAIGKWITFKPDTKLLSFGCAEGIDTQKLYKEYTFRLYGIESSEELIKSFKERYPDSEIKRATIKGTIDYSNNFFDYIFVFGVLHHIPNVSFVLKELTRVLKQNGIIVIREPISRMRTKRNPCPKVLSPNERGIPIKFFINEFEKNNLKNLEIIKAFYAPLMQLDKLLFNFFTRYPNFTFSIDKILCRLPYKDIYERQNIWEKIAPGAAYYIVAKLK